jgi:NitT/TauT family transport system substrate-binding protein
MDMRVQKRQLIAGLLGCLLLCALFPTGAAFGQELKAATFVPQWSPQAQFAGYYVAHAKGFYRRQGLDLKILRGGPDQPAAELLTEGRADFGTLFLTAGIALRARDVPLVNIGQIVQRSALLLVSLKKSGIVSPVDFNGKRVSVWDAFALQPQAFFQRNNLAVVVVPQGYTPNLFLRGGVDAASAMWYNEYHTILNAGIDADELNTFFLADFGLNFPEDGIYCRQEMLLRDPAMVRAFVQGSLEGWRYAFDHPEEALDIVMEHVTSAQLPTNRVHQKWMLARMQDIIVPPQRSHPMGTLLASDYRFVTQRLLENGIISTIPEYSDFHDPTPATPY